MRSQAPKTNYPVPQFIIRVLPSELSNKLGGCRLRSRRADPQCAGGGALQAARRSIRGSAESTPSAKSVFTLRPPSNIAFFPRRPPKPLVTSGACLSASPSATRAPISAMELL
ncbi:hypothetical protein EVAR_86168_1 [Eumeta japonica]|uniref:Uncharacterized protein n=1 Tax=Eumeta variegata TaxID=151549 RepID=A0A4C1Z4B5_EUMVA|nr:hypothetical protein EVAR_86168_1 [Eumeta japonica]